MDQVDNSSITQLPILKSLLHKGKTIKVLQILRKLKTQIDITSLIDQLLPYGNVLFYIFVKSENKDIMNSFHTFDKILNILEPKIIIDLLTFNIIDLEYSAKINNISLDKVIYMIIQFSYYNPEIKQYLFNKYSTYISTNYLTEDGLLRHMLFYNVCNDIFVYIRACKEYDKLTAEYITFDKVLISFQTMHDKYQLHSNYDRASANANASASANANASAIKNNIGLVSESRNRLVGVTHLIHDICYDKLLSLPEYTEYKENFETFYEITGISISTNIKDALDKLCYDSYQYINNKVPWGSQT